MPEVNMRWVIMRDSCMAIFASSVLLISCGPVSDENTSTGTSVEIAAGLTFRDDGRLTISRDGDIYAELAIEIADDDSTRARGMMQRTSMPDNTGMIFLFDQEVDRTFWMANTPLSLDLIFINADSTITMIKKYMQPLSARNVASEGPSQFVLEVIAGYSDTMGLIEGDRLSWYRHDKD